MTARNTWKGFERRIAALFGSKRTPLSGGPGAPTGADTQHPRLFIECKLRAAPAIWTLWQDVAARAKREGKTPVLAVQRKHAKGALLVIHTDHLDELINARIAVDKDNPWGAIPVEEYE